MKGNIVLQRLTALTPDDKEEENLELKTFERTKSLDSMPASDCHIGLRVGPGVQGRECAFKSKVTC
jgi:hypothetical protein